MPHYIKYDSRFYQIDGHCLNCKPSGHYRKTDKPCEFYEEKDLDKEVKDELKSAEKHLASMDERLNSLMHIFKRLIKERNSNPDAKN